MLGETLQKVLEFMTVNSKGDVYAGSMNEIARGCDIKNVSNISYSIKQLVKKGYVEYITRPARGKSQARYRIVRYADKSNDEFPKEIVIEFKGVRLKMIYIDGYGYMLSKKDLAKATGDYVEFIDYKIDRNKEQFAKRMTVVGEEVYMDRMAVMLYLSKLDLDSISDHKRNDLNEFQTIVASNMCEMMLRGTVKIDEYDRVKIQTNLSNLCDLSMEQVREFVEDIEAQFQKVYGEELRVLKDTKEDAKKYKHLYNTQLEKTHNWMSKYNEARLS